MPTSTFLGIATPVTTDNNNTPSFMTAMATNISNAFQSGLFAARPSVASGFPGWRYWATDRNREWIYVGTAGSGTWVPIGEPPGAIEALLYFNGTTTPVVPTGFLALDGGSTTTADTLYPDLWAILPTAVKSGTTFVRPDLRAAVTMGADNFGNAGGAGARGSVAGLDPAEFIGANAAAIVIGELPAHAHDMSHSHGLTTTAAGAHFHDILGVSGSGGLAQLAQIYNSGYAGLWVPDAGNAGSPKDRTTTDPGHTHGDSVQAIAATTGNNGSGTAHSNLQLGYAVLLCIRT